MSSIGIGTGVPTGALYLFPLITKTVSLNNNKWAALKMLYIPTYSWALGTAFGELPPYFIALKQSTKKRVYNSAEEWIKNIIQKYDFKGIVFLASYPNAMFDMCGLICGYFKIPLRTFLGATILGKAGIKATW
jgi:vacuole membrane protein 1